MTKQEIIKKVNSFQGANREFSQEMGPIVEGILDMVEDNTEAIETKQDAPEEDGTAGQILKLDANGEPVWADAPDGSVIDDEMSDESPNPVKNNVIWSWVTGLISTVKEWASNLFAKQDGWYDTLVSGAAKNLVGHDTTPAEYTFRTSGGNADIGTGAATIDVMKGKTLKWNQLVQKSIFKEITGDLSSTDNGDGSYTINGTTDTVTTVNKKLDAGVVNVIQNHVYYVKGGVTGSVVFNVYDTQATVSGKSNQIFTALASKELGYIRIHIPAGTYNNYKLYPQLFDLTDLFGAGNEPSTVTEFEALYPLDYYAYTPTHILINNAASGIVTTGFNQWDEEWDNIESSRFVHSKNYIPVFHQEYFLRSGNGNASFFIFEYDKNFTQLRNPFAISPNITYTPQAACKYIKFRVASGYGTTYNNDICINISDPAKNGTYEPYEKHTFYFDKVLQGEGSLATIKGKLNGEGESVVVFPEGLKRVGTVYDEIKGNVAIKRIGSRAYTSGDESDATVITDGTNTYYALATPETYTLDQTVTGGYQVNALGTEKRLPEDTASAVNAPVSYSVIYPIDAVGTITKLPINYISEKSLTNFTTELASKLGTFLNATITITPSYDATNEEYDYSISITANENNG